MVDNVYTDFDVLHLGFLKSKLETRIINMERDIQRDIVRLESRVSRQDNNEVEIAAALANYEQALASQATLESYNATEEEMAGVNQLVAMTKAKYDKEVSGTVSLAPDEIQLLITDINLNNVKKEAQESLLQDVIQLMDRGSA